MQFVVKVLRISTVVVVAAISFTAVNAQTDNDKDNDNDSSFRTSCADVKPPAVKPADMIDGVPLYVIPAGASGHRAACRATEALAEGMVDVELGEDRGLAHALGDSVPETVTGGLSKFPYSEPGSRPTPGLAPPGPSPEVSDHSRAYAAFVDPTTGVEYTFSSVAENLADAEAAGAEWVKSTVEPLLKQHAAKAGVQTAAPDTPVADGAGVAANVTDAAANATEPPPNYTSQAWTLLIVATLMLPRNDFVGGLVHGEGRSMGKSAAVVKFYRLNANHVDSDFFLVDTAYTQTPSYDPFTKGLDNYVYWANKETSFQLGVIDHYHPLSQPSLLEFAPRTVVSSSEQTFSVGAKLSADLEGPSGDLTAEYSVTRNQPDVETVVKATLGESKLAWTDSYNGFDTHGKYPATVINTFTGERLAIFQVPRTVNDVPPKVWAGLEFQPYVLTEVQGFFQTFFSIHKNFEYANWQVGGSVFVPEPRFSVHGVPQGAPIYPRGHPSRPYTRTGHL